MTKSTIVLIGCYCRAYGRNKNNQLVSNWVIWGSFSEKSNSSSAQNSMIAVISPNELSWLQFTFAHAKPSFCCITRLITSGIYGIVQLHVIEKTHKIKVNLKVHKIIILWRSVVLSIFYRNLFRHARVILLTHIAWSPLRLSTRGLIKKLSLQLFRWQEMRPLITKRFMARILVNTQYFRYVLHNTRSGHLFHWTGFTYNRKVSCE